VHALYDPGSEIVTNGFIGKCVEKARHYLRHDAEREAIANAGYLRATGNYTWEHRFSGLSDLLRGCD